MDGLEVLRRIRGNTSQTDIPIIMCTANNTSSDVVDALEAGANDYVSKPIDFPVLLARVNAQVERKLASAQLAAANEALNSAKVDLERRVAERTNELVRSTSACSGDRAARAIGRPHALPRLSRCADRPRQPRHVPRVRATRIRGDPRHPGDVRHLLHRSRRLQGRQRYARPFRRRRAFEGVGCAVARSAARGRANRAARRRRVRRADVAVRQCRSCGQARQSFIEIVGAPIQIDSHPLDGRRQRRHRRLARRRRDDRRDC